MRRWWRDGGISITGKLQAGLSLSRYLAELVKRDAANASGWPEGYFDLFVPIEGAEIERAPQGEFEERLPLE